RGDYLGESADPSGSGPCITGPTGPAVSGLLRPATAADYPPPSPGPNRQYQRRGYSHRLLPHRRCRPLGRPAYHYGNHQSSVPARSRPAAARSHATTATVRVSFPPDHQHTTPAQIIPASPATPATAR